ncbi:MAG: hypothetical protein QXT26_08630, partial [Thermoproteota archaeon]
QPPQNPEKQVETNGKTNKDKKPRGRGSHLHFAYARASAMSPMSSLSWIITSAAALPPAFLFIIILLSFASTQYLDAKVKN